MKGIREVHNSVVLKSTTSSKKLETNKKNGRCLNQWTMFLAANKPQNLEWLFTRCQSSLKLARHGHVLAKKC